nr:hypothetical protein [Sphingomonadales bacterium]
MEIAIPLIALGSLFVASKSKADDDDEEMVSGGVEGFTSTTRGSALPNVDVANRNFPSEYPVISADADQTSQLSTTNRYDGQSAYTDKFFRPSLFGSSEPVQTPTNQYYSMTGDRVDATYFQHNNMVPFFGSSQRTRLLDENSNEGLLDNMVGTGSQIFTKTEQSPLFAPSENMQWAYGMPNATDFVQSRMNVSQRMANVKPFEEERVRPGLGKDGEYSLGFNSGMMAREMWMPKDVDQMRAVNKTKASGLSLEGREGPAMSRITNIGVQAPVEKNRPDRHFEMDSSRYFTTTVQGQSLGPTRQALPVDRNDPHRATATGSYVGGAGVSAQHATYTEGEYMPSKHQDLGAVPLGGMDAVGHGGAREGDYAVASNRTYANNRTTANVDDYFGAVGGAIGAVVAPLLDILRPSRKENTVGNLRPYENPTSEVKNSYVFNPADRPDPTMRELSENSIDHYNVNRGQHTTGYLTNQHTPAYTTRGDTGDFEYVGVGQTTGAKQMRTYDAEYRQRNNDIKSSTIQGRMVSGNMKLMNGDINMRTKQQLDKDLDRRSYVSNANLPYQSPNVSQLGMTAGNNGLYAGLGLDRNQPDVLSSLQDNPFHHSILNAFR